MKLCLLVALTVAHRAWIVSGNTTISADGAFYLQQATDLYEGNIQYAFAGGYLHPLYMILTTTLGDLLGSIEAGAYVLAVAASAFAIIPLFFLVRSLWNERVAWWTCLIYALHPTLSLESSEVTNTSLYLCMFASSVALIVTATRDGRWLYYPLAGILSALCYLTRPEGLILVIYFVIIVAVTIFRKLRRREDSSSLFDTRKPSSGWLKLISGFVVAGLVFTAFSLPYVVWMHRCTNKWVLTRRGAGFEVFKEKTVAMKSTQPPPPQDPVQPQPAPPPSPPAPPVARAPDGDKAPAPKDQKVPPSAETVRRGPIFRYWNTVQRKGRLAFFAPLLPLLGIGIWACRRQGGSWSRLSFLWGAAVLSAVTPLVFLALSPNFHFSARYLLPTVLLLLPWIAAGLTAIADGILRIPRVLSGSRALRMIAWIPPGVLLIAVLAKTAGARRVDECTFLDAGRWLKEHGPLPPRYVLSTTEKIPYYGGYRPYWLDEPALSSRRNEAAEQPEGAGPRDSVPDLVRRYSAAYKKENAAFLVLHDKALEHYYAPEFPAELERAGFQLLTTIDKGSRPEGTTVRIYQLKR